MRVHVFPEPRPPSEIPVAGVTLFELLGESATVEEVQHALEGLRHKHPDVIVRSDDEVRRFRTPNWTWANMAGLEGLVVIRSGRVVFWVITRMN